MMTDKKCVGIDCAWCANPECPNERSNMTDKIMVDNIDVSGCKHFCLEPQIPEIPLAGYSKICAEEYIVKYCEDNSNCYYKQLKRKAKECEGLRHGQHLQNKVIKDLQEQLQAEKEKVKELEEECKELKSIHIDLAGVKDCEIKELKQYKQALEEIKGMIQQEICKEECLYDWKKNCPDSDCRYNQILQKCEVLNDV